MTITMSQYLMVACSEWTVLNIQLLLFEFDDMIVVGLECYYYVCKSTQRGNRAAFSR